METHETPSYYGRSDGWEMLAELDLSEPDYSFDLLVVWRHEDGRVVFATDSGCSCPSPFEDAEPDDFKEFSWSAIEQAIAEAAGVNAAEAQAFREKLKEARVV